MEFKNFVEGLKECLNSMLKGNAEIIILEIQKYNRDSFTGMAIKGKKEVAPVFYLTELYQKYEKGTTIKEIAKMLVYIYCLLYTSPSPRDRTRSRMPSSA